MPPPHQPTPPLRRTLAAALTGALIGATSLSSHSLALAAAPATQLSVTGAVQQPTTHNASTLRLLPPSTQTVTFTSGSGSQAHTDQGTSLWGVLSTTVGIATDAAVKNDILGMYVVATGSDGYKALFSMGELNPAFGNQPDLIAYSLNGEPLGASGFARLVAPNDVKAGRYVSNLVSLEVFRASPVPEPGSVALVFVGAIGLFGWRTRSQEGDCPA